MNASPGAKLDVDAVSIRFAGVQVLEDVSFSVAPGTVHALIGPNGAGKSTLFNVLSGIYRPQSGSVRLDDEELIGLKPYKVAHRGVGRAFQNSSMFASLSVEENLLLGRHRLTRSGVLRSGLALPFARAEERESREKVREIAEFVGIEGILADRAGDLPYGDAKRVDVARALCSEPRLLLLDEPAAGMHTHEKATMRRTIRRIVEGLGTSVLLVEHDMGVVMATSDQITVLNFGHVLVTDSPAAVREDSRVIEAYLGHSAARNEVIAPDIDATASSTTLSERKDDV